MNPTPIARRLRRDQTDEERQLWRALRAGRFAGFKFRRQHPLYGWFLDFYCPAARLSVELDGSQHGFPDHIRRDQARAAALAAEGIEELRFWNHDWHTNRHGVLLAIWDAIQRRTGCARLPRKVGNHRFIPPEPGQLKPAPGHERRLLSPALSSIPNGGEGGRVRSGGAAPDDTLTGSSTAPSLPHPPSPSPPAAGGEGRGEEGHSAPPGIPPRTTAGETPATRPVRHPEPS